MALAKNTVVSAQVVLRPTSLKPRGEAPVTSGNIAEFLPSAEMVAVASRYFAGAGFEVGQTVANSFSITAKVAGFEKAFGVTLRSSQRGGVECVHEDGSRRLEIPLQSLPAEVAALLEVVTFTPPPDFGPTEFA